MTTLSPALKILTFLALGVLLGLGLFTFQYGQGWSYFSSDPAACANCHIMGPWYKSWRLSGHKQVTGCNDCHMPEGLAAKLVAKADNGLRHSWGFTFNSFHEPIRITERNREILEGNCLRCHGEVAHSLRMARKNFEERETMNCVKCHAVAGHGNMPGRGKYTP